MEHQPGTKRFSAYYSLPNLTLFVPVIVSILNRQLIVSESSVSPIILALGNGQAQIYWKSAVAVLSLYLY